MLLLWQSTTVIPAELQPWLGGCRLVAGMFNSSWVTALALEML
jgi:hypothetical protein